MRKWERERGGREHEKMGKTKETQKKKKKNNESRYDEAYLKKSNRNNTNHGTENEKKACKRNGNLNFHIGKKKRKITFKKNSLLFLFL